MSLKGTAFYDMATDTGARGEEAEQLAYQLMEEQEQAYLYSLEGMLPYDDMDIECIAICEAINLIPDVQTRSSCCGHGERPFKIWFSVDDLKQLPDLLYWIDTCHSPEAFGWQVTVETDCAKQYPTFCLEGPAGAYEDADALAERICFDNFPDD